MKWQEIQQRYKNEWVLVEVTRFDEENYEILEGVVLCHSDDYEEFAKQSRGIATKFGAVEYLGQYPDNLALMCQTSARFYRPIHVGVNP